MEGFAYGIVRQERKDGTNSNTAAVEVTDIRDLPDGTVSVEIPAATCAMFAHRGPAKNIDHTVSYAYATWLGGSGMRHTYGADLEIYGKDEYHPTSDDSVIYYALPIDSS